MAGLVLLGVCVGIVHHNAATQLSSSVQSIPDSVPIEFEVERARQIIEELDLEIRRNMHEVAKGEVEVAKLSHEVERKEAKLLQVREEILRIKADLDEGRSDYVYAGQQYTADEVQANLKIRFERFKTEEAATDTLRKMLTAREAGLTAARQKLTEMRNAKEQLMVDFATLEGWRQAVKSAQFSDPNFDNGNLSRAKKLIRDIGGHVEAAEKLVNADLNRPEDISVDENNDMSTGVVDYFGEGRSEVEAFVNPDKDAAAADEN